MGAALVNHVKFSGQNTNTSGAIDTTGANFLAVVLSENGAGSVTFSDSKGNTWSTEPPTEQTTITAPALKILYCKNPTVGTGHTFTCTGSSIFFAAEVAAFSGMDVASPYDQDTGTGGGAMATGQQCGSLTPPADGYVFIIGIGGASAFSATPTLNGGATVLDFTDYSGGANFAGGLGYLIQGTAAAYNPAWSWTGGATPGGNVIVATFKVTAATTITVPAGVLTFAGKTLQNALVQADGLAHVIIRNSLAG